MSKLPPSFVELMENGSEEVRRFLQNIQPVTVSREPEEMPAELGDDLCWIWQSSTSGEAQTRRRAYEILKGPIPHDMRVARKCGNLLCVNPRHLELVKRTEIPLRVPSGNRLAPEQRDEVRQAIASGEPQAAIAQRFGISQAQVSLIKNNKTWREQRDVPFIPATAQQVEQAEEHPALSLTAWLDLQERRLGPVGQLARGEAMSDEQRDRAFSKAIKEFTIYQLLSREYDARRSEAC